MKYQPKSNEGNKKYTPSLHWAIPEKNKQWEVEDMEFQGLSKKQNAEFTGVGDQEKIMWNLQGSWLLVLEFPRDVIQFCTIFRCGALICLEFPGVK